MMQRRGPVRDCQTVHPCSSKPYGSISCSRHFSLMCERRRRCAAQQAGTCAAHTSCASVIEYCLSAPLPELMQRAAALRDKGHSVISFSPKVFIPLTRLCRDSCGYCTFAQPPAPGRRAYMTLNEVLQVRGPSASRNQAWHDGITAHRVHGQLSSRISERPRCNHK